MRLLSSFACAALLLLTGPAIATAQQMPAPNAPPETAGDKTYRVFADTVTAGFGRPGVQGVNCVTQTVFFPGDVIIFRAVVADGPSGTPLTAADVASRGVAAVVTLSDGVKVPLTLKMHPPPPNAPSHSTYWSGALKTPADHPTGTLKWTLAVTDKAGAAVTFEPLGQAAGQSTLTLAQKPPSP